MLLLAPKGSISVSLGGQEYKVENRLVEVPDYLGAQLFPHGFTAEIPEELQPAPAEPETPLVDPPKEPETPPADPPIAEQEPDQNQPEKKPPDDKVKNSPATGGDKNGK